MLQSRGLQAVADKQKTALTKVRHLGHITPPIYSVGLQQHIAQLEVSMNDTKAMDVVHAFGYLLRCPQQRSLHQHQGMHLA